MFKHKSTKSALFLVIAVIMTAAVMLAACNPNVFKPVAMPDAATAESNGGNAVKYGEWIYYVNGYQSSVSEENTYVEVEARVGAIARIKIADLEKLFAVYDDTNFTSSSARTAEIARLVKENAEIVVPKFYYSGNTTTTQLNGIYIFDERLYILTPNDQLTAGGNSQTSQSVLTSFKLDGSDEQRHYVFTNNAAQIMLDKIDGKLLATYIMGTEVGCVDVSNGTLVGSAITETSSAQFDVAGKAVVYLDKDGSICKLNAGATEAKTLVENKKEEGHDHSHLTYTIASANAGYVYYTVANSNNSSVDGVHLYYATEAKSGEIALATSVPSTYYGYKETIVCTKSISVPGTTLYGIYVINSDGSEKAVIVKPIQNDNSITFNRIEGDILYYTSNSVAYKVDLSAQNPEPVPYGKSLSSASGWSVPDVIGNYVITLSTGSVSVVKFNADTLDNGSSVTITKVVTTEDDKDK